MAVGDKVVQLGLQSLAMVVIGGGVYALTRVLRFRHQAWSFAHPRDAASWGIGAISYELPIREMIVEHLAFYKRVATEHGL